jgi:sugar phosphate permease
LGLLGTQAPGQAKIWPFFIQKILDGTLQSFAWAVQFSIVCNWFPKQGRGVLIGFWATCPSVGDIIGQQLFIGIVGDNIDTWNIVYYILAAIIFLLALVNYFFLIEFPKNVGLTVKENSKFINPSEKVAQEETQDSE